MSNKTEDQWQVKESEIKNITFVCSDHFFLEDSRVKESCGSFLFAEAMLFPYLVISSVVYG